jgi:RHS repeat-associated protein
VLANILSGLGVDEFLTRTDVPAGATSSFLTDALGSAIALADSAGAVQSEYTYEPFGRTTVTGAPNANPFQYTSRENDGIGLYYYRARYYHPELQRFAGEDLLVSEQRNGTDLYVYGNDNPVNLRDPFGLWTFQAGITVGGTVSGVTGSFFAGIAFDSNGNVGTYWGSGVGVGVGAGAYGGVGGALSNANDICGLGGPFMNLSGAAGSGASGTGDYFTGSGNGPGGVVTGAGGTIALGGGASSSAQRTKTWVNPLVGRKSCPES